MSPADTTEAELLARIDQPDFLDALAADSDGSFASEVNAYLDTWEEKIRQNQSAGLATEDYKNLSRLAASIGTARQVIEFFVKVQKLPPTP